MLVYMIDTVVLFRSIKDSLPNCHGPGGFTNDLCVGIGIER